MKFKDLPRESKLGDQPIEEKHRAHMIAISQALDKFLNGDKKGPEREVGFVLLVFEYGEKEGRCNYISNGADRHDVVKLMQEQIKRFTMDNVKQSDA